MTTVQRKLLRKQRRIAALKQATVQRQNIRYIVVHSSFTKNDLPLNALENLPYHYVITKSGRLLSLHEVHPKDGTIELALLGGMDKEGNHVDSRTVHQNETLFNTLVMLTERFPDAHIKSADQLYVYSFPNPGFNIQQWLTEYLPALLLVA
ncbi:MAG TPA: hypothetical protein VM802_10175 [Chitinophaga sp.]|uniref:hypothetical protein n=1 Tax=Chitinophaga sp. TaxID=1869181 RepID=UPI002D186210|nr:hypothetical protein [Chitinophaga sp.]HVI45229.1 hypothetical protein [Chitinophaga sp.]